MKSLRCIIKKVWYDFGGIIFIISFFIGIGTILYAGVWYETNVTHTKWIMYFTLVGLIGALLFVVVDWIRNWLKDCMRYIKELKEWCAD